MSMFSKKHYVKIAELLATLKSGDEILPQFCAMFKQDNKKFDEIKFVAYYVKKRGEHFGK